MRISDWSSDVCLPIYPIIQADIGAAQPDEAVVERPEAGFAQLSVHRRAGVGPVPDHRAARCSLSRGNAADEIGGAQPLVDEIGRASCRERLCRTCRSRWSPYHSKKKNNKTKNQ